MNKTIKKRSFGEYIKNTYKNKFYAILLFMIGFIFTKVSNESGFLIFILFISTPLFFANKNYIG